MANFHSVSFAVAGSRQAVNQAILLMEKNIAAYFNRKSPVKEFDDPSLSFEEYRRDIDLCYNVAFAGVDTQDRYLGQSAEVNFDGNDQTCALFLNFATAGSLNEEDLATFAEALGKTCAFEACALHGDEYDDYNDLRFNTYSADGTGEVDWEEDAEFPFAGDLARELRMIHRRGKVRNLTDPQEMARAAAIDIWSDWTGESVFDALWESGVFGDDADEDEALELWEEYPNDVVLFYASRRRGPLTREKIENAH